jgi:hypothetical protein
MEKLLVTYDFSETWKGFDATWTGDVPGYTLASGCGTCKPGFFGPNSASTCSACPANTGDSCTACTAITTCPCNANYYGANGGSCSLCPANSASTAGSTTLSMCTCNAGFYGPNGGTCTACPAGKYKHRSGSKQCTNTLYQTDQNSVCDNVRDMSLASAVAKGGVSVGEQERLAYLRSKCFATGLGRYNWCCETCAASARQTASPSTAATVRPAPPPPPARRRSCRVLPIRASCNLAPSVCAIRNSTGTQAVVSRVPEDSSNL